MKLNIREFTDGKKVIFYDDNPRGHIMIMPYESLDMNCTFLNINRVHFIATKISYETWLKQIT